MNGKAEQNPFDVMTDTEYNILDQLYFVSSFSRLLSELDMPEGDLKTELANLIDKDWVKVLDKNADTEIQDKALWEKEFKNLQYLATKKGLFAHNTI